MSCIMAAKKTGLNNRGYVGIFFAVVFVLGCSKGREEASISVPVDLIKETEGSQYIVAAWNFEATP